MRQDADLFSAAEVRERELVRGMRHLRVMRIAGLRRRIGVRRRVRMMPVKRLLLHRADGEQGVL